MIQNIEDLIDYLHRFLAPWGDPKPAPPPNVSHLPRPLARLYQELGGLIGGSQNSDAPPGPFAAEALLAPPMALKEVGAFVEFARERNGRWSCRYKPGTDDPDVYSNAGEHGGTGAHGFQVVCGSLEHFLITLSLHEAVLSASHLVELEPLDTSDDRELELRPLWMQGVFVEGKPTRNFYRFHDNALVMGFGQGVWVAANSADIEDLIDPFPFKRIRAAS